MKIFTYHIYIDSLNTKADNALKLYTPKVRQQSEWNNILKKNRLKYLPITYI